MKDLRIEGKLFHGITSILVFSKHCSDTPLKAGLSRGYLCFSPKEGDTIFGIPPKWMEKKLERAGIELSVFRALEELGKVGAVELVTDKGRVMLRTDIEGLSNQILRTLGVKIPSRVLSKTH